MRENMDSGQYCGILPLISDFINHVARLIKLICHHTKSTARKLSNKITRMLKYRLLYFPDASAALEVPVFFSTMDLG